MAVAAPSLALVEGEPGIGKSRLIAELLDAPQLDGYRCLVGGCHPGVEPFPLGPVLDALRRVGPGLGSGLSAVAGALRPLLPELAEVLPPQPPPLADAVADRHRLFRGIVAVLERLAPVVLVLEDLHWGDTSTLELLTYLAAEPPAGVAVVLTYRREDLPEASPLLSLLGRSRNVTASGRITLSPLDRREVGALAAALLGENEVSADFAQYLHERTAGLPFAVEEVVQLLRDRLDLVPQDGHWIRRMIEELQVPPAVSDSVRERLDRLPGDAAALIGAAAVLDRPTDETTLTMVAAVADPSAALEAAVGSGLLCEKDGGYTLRHALARDAVYQHLPSPRRRLLHDRAASALADVGDPRPLADLARHCREAGRADEWASYTEALADVALAARNDAAAADLLLDLLASLPPGADVTGRVAVKAGHAAFDALAHARALPVLQQVVAADALAPRMRGELRFLIGRLLVQADRPAEGRQQFVDALDDLRGCPALLARAMAYIAFAGWLDGRLLEDAAWADRAWELAQPLEDSAARMAVAVNRASVLLEAGDERWPSVLDEVADLGTSTGARSDYVVLCLNASWSLLRLGHYALARRWLDGAADDVEDAVRHRGTVVSHGLLLDWYCGRWEGLQQRTDAFLTAPGRLIDARDGRLVAGGLLLADAHRDAQGFLEDFVASMIAARAVHHTAAATSGLVRLLVAKHSAGAAVRHALAAIDLVAAEGTWVAFGEVGVAAVEALVSDGRSSDAADVVAAAENALSRRDAPAAKASVAHCRGLLADHAEDVAAATRWYDRAGQAWRQLPRPYEATQARERRGNAADAADADGGRDVLLAVLDDYERLGAAWDADRVRATLRDRGVSLRHRSGRRGSGDGLTPRQRQVTQLAAAGLTNQEIADQLFLSRRTVDGHLARVMEKLGVSSRRELPSEAPDTARTIDG